MRDQTAMMKTQEGISIRLQEISEIQHDISTGTTGQSNPP
jgi:hypothetical protein